jgi:hypothetical protein
LQGARGREDELTHDDDVLDEDWFKYRMVRSHRLVSLLVLVAIGVGRRIQKGSEMRKSNKMVMGYNYVKSKAARWYRRGLTPSRIDNKTTCAKEVGVC